MNASEAVYLVWVRESYADYDVILTTLDKTKAEAFISSGEWKQHVTNEYVEQDDLTIEERKLNTPKRI